LKANFNRFEKGFALSERECQLESMAFSVKKVLPHFCRVKTEFEQR